jgi:cytochrome c oxidase cbb3-type subunit IV
MTYDNAVAISQIAALIFFVALFVGVVAYAFWPGNKKRFEKDARIPLERDPEQEKDEERHG